MGLIVSKMRLTRTTFLPDRTIGKLEIQYQNQEEWCEFGWVVEDTDRGLDSTWTLSQILKRKVKGRTAIPTGTYRVGYTWSPKYQREVPLLHYVLGFQGIRIHAGNGPEDTEGCICPGLRLDKSGTRTIDSQKAVDWIEAKLRESAKAEVMVDFIICRASPIST